MMAWDGLCVAGPTGAYEYFARSADGMADAKGSSPAPPIKALVTIISTEGMARPTRRRDCQGTARHCHDDRRPVADRLSVQSAGIIHYTITASCTSAARGPRQM